MEKFAFIRDAIRNRRNVQFDYKGRTRVVSFYVADNEKAFGLQVGGSSSSGRLGVRMFDLAEMSGLVDNPSPYQEPRSAPSCQCPFKSPMVQLLEKPE